MGCITYRWMGCINLDSKSWIKRQYSPLFCCLHLASCSLANKWSCYTSQLRFLIGGERVTCHWSKLHDALGRTKLHDALGQQQLELSTHTWSGRAPLKRRQICTPADVKQIIFICVLFYFELGGITKHLMTGPKGNSEFCFPSISMFPSASPRGTLRVSGKQNSLFPLGPVIKCLMIDYALNHR